MRGTAAILAAGIGALVMPRNVDASSADAAAAGTLDEVVVTSARETAAADRAEAASEGIVTQSSSKIARCCDRAKCWKPCPGS